MNQRPRRHISARTKRKCRLIRDFFRRVFGIFRNSEVNSSTSVNVDSKHTLHESKHQPNEDNTYINQDQSIDSSNFREKSHLGHYRHQYETAYPKKASSHEAMDNCSRTRVHNKSDKLTTFDESNITSKNRNMDSLTNSSYTYSHLVKHRKHDKQNDRKHEMQKCETWSTMENVSTRCHSLASLQKLSPHLPRTKYRYEHRTRYDKHRDYTDAHYDKSWKAHNPLHKDKYISPERHHRNKLDKYEKGSKERLKEDREILTQIIEKQYKPTKLFRKRPSEISQCSAPQCHHQKYLVEKSADHCPCCYKKRVSHRHSRHTCDRLYESHCDCKTQVNRTKYTQPNLRCKHCDTYYDCSQYDMVPVKEILSPKSKRKLVENNITRCEYKKEVPPSSETHRPRLNLKTLYHPDYEEYLTMKHNSKKCLSEQYKCKFEFPAHCVNSDEETSKSDNLEAKSKQQKPSMLQSVNLTQHDINLSNMQNHSFHRPVGNVDNLETDASEKTDKILTEIKDTLQSFLQEIKKLAIPQVNVAKGGVQQTVTQSPNSPELNTILEGALKLPIVPIVAQCSVPSTVPLIRNPCCYSLIPTCYLNYMQNTCTSNCNHHGIPAESFEKKDVEPNKNEETRELIKQIYDRINLNSPDKEKSDIKDVRKKEDSVKRFSSRSVECSCALQQDYNTQQQMNCFSKSCEVLDSHTKNDTSSMMESEAVTEEASLETRSDVTLNIDSRKQQKPSKFSNILKSIRLLKKRRKKTVKIDSTLDASPILQPTFQELYFSVEQEYYQYLRDPSRYGYITSSLPCCHRYVTPGNHEQADKKQEINDNCSTQPHLPIQGVTETP